MNIFGCSNKMKKIFLLLILIIPLSFIRGQAYWKEITTMRYPVTGGQVVFNNSRIEPKFYILGGYSDSLQKAIDWIQEYDLIKNTWRIVGKLNTPRMFFLSSIWDSSIVYCGGADPGSGFRESITLWNYYKENEPAVYDTNTEFDREFAAGQVYGLPDRLKPEYRR